MPVARGPTFLSTLDREYDNFAASKDLAIPVIHGFPASLSRSSDPNHDDSQLGRIPVTQQP